MFGFSRKQVYKSLLFSVGWMLFLALFAERPFWSFKPGLHDHISNLHATVLFWEKGFDIFKYPPNDLLKQDRSEQALALADYWQWPVEEFYEFPERSNTKPLMLVWGQMPRPYPPGLYLLLSPFALFMEALGGFSEEILILITLIFCFVAHLVFFQVYNLARQNEVPQKFRWLMTLFLASIYFELVGWSLCSQYEVFGLFFLIPSLTFANEKKFTLSFIFFCISSFIHFRAILWALPMGLLWITQLKTMAYEIKNFRWQQTLMLGFATVLGLIAGSVFLMVLGPLLHTNTPSNAFSKALIAGDWGPRHFLFMAGLPFILFHFGRQKNWLLLASLGSILLLFLRAALLQPWYALYVLPLFFAFKQEKEPFQFLVIRYAAVALLTGFILNSSPTDFHFVRKMLELMI